MSETLEDFISKMKVKDKKAKTVEMEYKNLAQNGRSALPVALQEKNQLIELLAVLNDKTKKIKKHVKDAKHSRKESSQSRYSPETVSISSRQSSSRR